LRNAVVSVIGNLPSNKPFAFADGDDAVDDDAGPGAFPRDLGEDFP